MTGVSVLVGDAHALFADALARVLGRQADLHVLAEYPQEGVAALDGVERLRPDVAVLDYWLRGMEGSAVARAVRARAPDTSLLLLGWLYDPVHVQDALVGGAAGFLPKDACLDDLVRAVRAAAEGQRTLVPERYRLLAQRADRHTGGQDPTAGRLAMLTPRELQVLHMLAEGLTAAKVARRLVVSETTVRSHMQGILDTTGAGSQREALALARRYGVIR